MLLEYCCAQFFFYFLNTSKKKIKNQVLTCSIDFFSKKEKNFKILGYKIVFIIKKKKRKNFSILVIRLFDKYKIRFSFYQEIRKKEITKIKTGKTSIFFQNLKTKIFFIDFENFREIYIKDLKINSKLKKILKTSFFPLWNNFFFWPLKNLNYIQSITFPRIYGTDLNILLISPTGTGKTVLAGISIFRLIINSIERQNTDFKIKKDFIKVLYLAPLKTLVREIIKNFRFYFRKFYFKIDEISGENEIDQKKIFFSNILIGTPEKINNFIRFGKRENFLKNLKLLVVDEIHLLNEKRGVILEEILIQFLSNKKLKKSCRIIGLSATVPNFFDLARFLNVNFYRGLFYFGKSFKQNSSNQTIIGIKNFISQKRVIFGMNEIAFKKIELLRKNKKNPSIIIFVHSRRDTLKTALHFLKENKNNNFYPTNLEKFQKKLFDQKIGFHHGGLSKKKKNLMEHLFRIGNINILISTTTLAWGVNLPVTDIIIKGTKIYSPEMSSWKEISDLSVIQMMGRAGRAPSGKKPESILITSFQKIDHYFSLLNFQLPIESRLITFLPDAMNNFCSEKKILGLEGVIVWFSKTFFFIRLYRYMLVMMGNFDEERKKKLESKFVVQILKELKSAGMLIFYPKSGLISSTKIGKIASRFSINHQTIVNFLSRLCPDTNIGHLLTIISSAQEFFLLQLRKEEEKEIKRLQKLIFFPQKNFSPRSTMKINVLIQSFVGNIRIFNLPLLADSIFIAKKFSRILKAIFHLGLIKRWCFFSSLCFDFFKAFLNQEWPSNISFGFSSKIFFEKNILKTLPKGKIGSNLIDSLNFKNYKNIYNFEKSNSLKKKMKGKIKINQTKVNIKPLTRNTIKISIALRFKEQNSDIPIKKKGYWVFIEDQITDTLICHRFFFLEPQKIKKNLILHFFLPFFSNPFPPFFNLKIKSLESSFFYYEETIDLGDIFLPFNHMIDTHLGKFTKITFSRIFSGIDFGDILVEYFETHRKKIAGHFYQIISYILKRGESNLLASGQRKEQNIFGFFSLFAFLNKNERFGFLFLSSGFQSIILKKLKIKNSSTGMLGLSILKITKNIVTKINKFKKKIYLFLAGFSEFFLVKKLFLLVIFPKFVFWIEHLNFISNKNFAYAIETFLSHFLKNKNEKIYLIGCIFPFSNLFEITKWAKFKVNQIFSFNFRKYFAKKNRFRWKTNHDLFYKEKSILKKPSTQNQSLCIEKSSIVKKKFLKLISNPSFFFSFLFSPKNLNIIKKISRRYSYSKILTIFSGFRVGFLSEYWISTKKRIIMEFFLVKKISNLFITEGCFSIIDKQKINGKFIFLENLCYQNQTTEFLDFSKIFLSERLFFNNFLNEFCGFLFKNILSEIITLESTLIFTIGEILSPKVPNINIMYSIITKKKIFLSFFFKRGFHNPQFYGFQNYEFFEEFFRKKLIFLGENLKRKINQTTIKYCIFHSKSQKFLFCKIFKSPIRFLSHLVLQKKQLWVLKFLKKCVKKYPFLDLFFYNKISLKNRNKKYFDYVLHFFWKEIQEFLFQENFYFNQKLNFNLPLFFSELKQGYQTKIIRKGNKSEILSSLNQFEKFLLKKIHNIDFKENIFKNLFLSDELKKFTSKIMIRKFIRKVFFSMKFTFIVYLKKKKNFFLYLDFKIWEEYNRNSNFYFFLNEILFPAGKKLRWNFLIGNLKNDEIFLFRKIVLDKNSSIKIKINIWERIDNIQFFYLNDSHSRLDKEFCLKIAI